MVLNSFIHQQLDWSGNIGGKMLRWGWTFGILIIRHCFLFLFFEMHHICDSLFLRFLTGNFGGRFYCWYASCLFTKMKNWNKECFWWQRRTTQLQLWLTDDVRLNIVPAIKKFILVRCFSVYWYNYCVHMWCQRLLSAPGLWFLASGAPSRHRVEGQCT